MVKFLTLKIRHSNNIIIDIIPSQKYQHHTVRNINKIPTKISLYLLFFLLFSIVIVLLLSPYGYYILTKISRFLDLWFKS